MLFKQRGGHFAGTGSFERERRKIRMCSNPRSPKFEDYHHRSFLPNRRNKRYLNYFSSSRSNTNEICSRTRLARERSIVSRLSLKRKRREINRNSRRIAADIVSFDSTAPLTRAGRLVSSRERPKPVKSVECNPCGVRDVKADVQASTVFH